MTEQKHQILVVDDDPSEVVLLRRRLDKAGVPYELTACHEPSETLPLLASRDFTIVFLDHHLGAVTGLDVLQDIVVREGHPPVVMLTGQGDERIAVAALQAGASDYLPKSGLTADAVARTIAHAVEKQRLEVLLAEHRANLEQANDVLVRKNREMESFYHTVSHELKTPLTSVLEYVSLVVEENAGPTTEEQQDYLGVALESCRQMVHYINDLLDVTRLETGKMTVEPCVCELGPFVERAVEALMPMAAERGIALETRIDADLPPVSIDERRIAQVIRNLVSNSLKFTPEEGQIHVVVRLGDEPDMLCVAVSDTGRGISERDCGLVFERLAQVSEDDYSTHGGLGLGLSISRELVQLHGGSIWVDSEPGTGSTFSFTVPVHDPSVQEQPV